MERETQAAILAGLAAGKSQSRVAEEAGVSRYQVRKVRDHLSRTGQRATAPVVSLSGLSGRKSKDKAGGALGTSSDLMDKLGSMMLEDPDTAGLNDKWMDETALKTLAPAKILERVVTTSPEMSRAVWDTMLMVNPGYEYKVYRPRSTMGKSRAEYTAAKAELAAFMERLSWRHGDVNVVLGRMTMALMMRGGLVSELVLNADGTDTVDIAVPDPNEFRIRMTDEGIVELSQWQGNEWVVMDRPTFRYIPLHPLPGRGQGRSPLMPALFPCLFILGVFQDLRRVIANQGYPRLDVSIALESVRELIEMEIANLPDDAEPVDVGSRIDAIMQKTKETFSKLAPGDSYVHLDVMELKNPVGTLGQQLQSVDVIVGGLERMAVRALKTMPLMMGLALSVSEANANRQWEIHAGGIKVVQHLIERMVESMLELHLQARGLIGDVEFRFAELRAAERLRDAQAEQLEIANAVEKMVRGFLRPSEAAQSIMEEVSDAVALTYPDDLYQAPAASEPDTTDTTEEPPVDSGDNEDLTGENKMARIGEVIPPAPAVERLGDADALRASAEWDQANPGLAGLLDAEVDRGE